MFGTTGIVINSNKEKWMYSDYGIAFNGKIEQSFGNNYSRNVMIFSVDKVHHTFW